MRNAILGGKHKPLQTDAVSAASLLVAEVAWNPIRKSVLHDVSVSVITSCQSSSLCGML